MQTFPRTSGKTQIAKDASWEEEGWEWWCMPVIPVLGSLRQEIEFEAAWAK
jgi:hypothetical protein